MIEYDSHDWIPNVFVLRGSMGRKLSLRITVATAWAALVTALFVSERLHGLSDRPHQLIGIALGLLLVFRTNASYDRFWEGRRQWGNITNASRNLARIVSVHCAAVPAVSREILDWVAAFPYSAMHKLRGEQSLGDAASWLERPRVDAVLAEAHVPLATLRRVTERLRAARDAGHLSENAWLAADRHVSELMDAIGACERIHSTPLPFGYVVHLRRAIMLYCGTLPFALVSEFRWWTIAVVLFVSFVMLGIEEIGVEIEDPFGTDDNDLPLEKMCSGIATTVRDRSALRLPDQQGTEQ